MAGGSEKRTAYRPSGSKTYPNLPIPKMRFWVIFNNQFRPVPQVTPPNWPAVIQRSLETSTRAATATAVRHLFAMAEIARLKRKADVEVRLVSIPGDWVSAGPRGVHQRDHEQSGRPGRKDGRGSGELEQPAAELIAKFDGLELSRAVPRSSQNCFLSQQLTARR